MRNDLLAPAGTRDRDSQAAPVSRRLLLTEDAPSYGVLAALRALRTEGFEPWLAITGRDSYARRSKASVGVVTVPDPVEDRAGYIDVLADAAERLGVAAVLPGTELGLVAVAAARDAFAPGIALGVDDPETVGRASDKLELEHLAAEAELQMPPTRHTTHAEVESGLEIQLPAIVKGLRTRVQTPNGFAASPSRRANNTAELLAAVRAIQGSVVLIQPALEGELIAIPGVAWQGEVVAIAHQRAVRIYPPGCGITSFAETVEADPELELGVGRLIGALGWSGIFQAQFIHSGGESYLIDLNPRIYGSLALAVSAGLNLPAIWADLLLGHTPQIGTYRVGARYRSEERDLAALGAAAAAGDWRTALGVLRPRRGTTHALGSMHDPLPLFASGRVTRIRRARARARS